MMLEAVNGKVWALEMPWVRAAPGSKEWTTPLVALSPLSELLKVQIRKRIACKDPRTMMMKNLRTHIPSFGAWSEILFE